MHHAKLNPELVQTSLMHHSDHFILVQPDLIWLELRCPGLERVFDCFTAVQMDPKPKLTLKLVRVDPVCSGLQFSWCYLGTKGSVGFFHSCPVVSETGNKKKQTQIRHCCKVAQNGRLVGFDRDFMNCLKPVSTGKTGVIPDRSVLFIHLDQTK